VRVQQMDISGTGAGASGPSYAIYVRGEGTRAAPSSSRACKCRSTRGHASSERRWRAPQHMTRAAHRDHTGFASCGLIHKLAPTRQIASGAVKLQTVFGDIQAPTHGVQRRHPRLWLHPWGGGLPSLGRGVTACASGYKAQARERSTTTPQERWASFKGHAGWSRLGQLVCQPSRIVDRKAETSSSEWWKWPSSLTWSSRRFMPPC